MKKLSLDILDAINPKYKEYQSISPLNVRYNEYTSQFSLNNQAWEEYITTINSVVFNWQEIKYEDVVNKVVSIEATVPNNIGIYLFIVRPVKMVNEMPKFVYYVGIAGADGGTRTLKERLKDYFAESNLKKRDKVQILIYKHYKNLFINYSELTIPTGITLEKIEQALIGFFGTHLLANTDDIPVLLKQQAKTFNI